MPNGGAVKRGRWREGRAVSRRSKVEGLATMDDGRWTMRRRRLRGLGARGRAACGGAGGWGGGWALGGGGMRRARESRRGAGDEGRWTVDEATSVRESGLVVWRAGRRRSSQSGRLVSE